MLSMPLPLWLASCLLISGFSSAVQLALRTLVHEISWHTCAVLVVVAYGGHLKIVTRANGSSDLAASRDDDSEAGTLKLMNPRNVVNANNGYCSGDAPASHSDVFHLRMTNPLFVSRRAQYSTVTTLIWFGKLSRLTRTEKCQCTQRLISNHLIFTAFC